MDQEKLAKINSWKRFSNSKLWQHIVNEMKKKIEGCDVVINTIGGDSQVAYSMRDVSILKRDAYYDLIKIPTDMIASLSGTEEVPVEDFDPYQDRGENDIDTE